MPKGLLFIRHAGNVITRLIESLVEEASDQRRVAMLTHEVESSSNFRFTTFEYTALLDYDHSGYLHLTKLFVRSDRRGAQVQVSERLALKFQETHWDYLYGECLQHSQDVAEYCRDRRRAA